MKEKEIYLKYSNQIRKIVNAYDSAFVKLTDIEQQINELRKHYDEIYNKIEELKQQEQDLLDQIKQEKADNKHILEDDINNHEVNLNKIIETLQNE